MYLHQSNVPSPIIGPSEMRSLLALNDLAFLGLGILPGSLMALCFIAIKSI